MIATTHPHLGPSSTTSDLINEEHMAMGELFMFSDHRCSQSAAMSYDLTHTSSVLDA